MLKIEFEHPSHGWMPVKITYKNIEKNFAVSDVPIDPISQLENVLDSAITGLGGEVWWHLEPGGYYLSLFAENNEFNVSLEFSMNSMKETRERVFEYTGSFEETVVPIWRSLRKLQSHNWNEFSVSREKMESITKQVKSWSRG